MPDLSLVCVGVSQSELTMLVAAASVHSSVGIPEKSMVASSRHLYRRSDCTSHKCTSYKLAPMATIHNSTHLNDWHTVALRVPKP